MLNVTVAGTSAVQQSNNSITAGLISPHPNEIMSLEQAMASTSFFSPKGSTQNQSFGKLLSFSKHLRYANFAFRKVWHVLRIASSRRR